MDMKKTNRQIDSSSSSVYFSVCMCTRLYEIFICISPEGLLFSGDFRGKKSGIYELVSLFYNFFLSLLEIHVCTRTLSHTRSCTYTYTYPRTPNFHSVAHHSVGDRHLHTITGKSHAKKMQLARENGMEWNEMQLRFAYRLVHIEHFGRKTF